LNNALWDCAPGTTIVVEKGTYYDGSFYLSTKTEPDCPVHVTCEKPGDAILRAPLIIDEGSNIIVSNLAFSEDAKNGIVSKSPVENLTVKSVTFSCYQTGIYTKDTAKNLWIENSVFANGNYGVYTEAQCDNVTIRGCSFKEMKEECVCTGKPVSGLMIEESTFSNAVKGVYLQTWDNCDHVTIRGCKFKDFESSGIYLTHMTHALVEGCSFEGLMPSAIVFGYNSREGIVKGCDITTSQKEEGRGTFISNSGSSDFSFLNNTFKSADGLKLYAGISSDMGSNCFYQGNVFYLNNTQPAIQSSHYDSVCASNIVIGDAPVVTHGTKIDESC